MNKKSIFYIVVLSVVVICVGLFVWNRQRQDIYEQTRKMIAPVYKYSGKLTPEELKSYSEFAESMSQVDPAKAKKFALPKRESLKLEAHTMSLHSYNPELFFKSENASTTNIDVKPYQRNCSILALIAKIKLAGFPTSSRTKIFQHLESLNKRLIINSVESAMLRAKKNENGNISKFPDNVFGVKSHFVNGASQPKFQVDGSVKMPEQHKRGVINITDVYGNEYTLDLDSQEDISMTEDTNELYAEIDQLFNTLSDAEFQRLAELNKTDLESEIDKLILTE